MPVDVVAMLLSFSSMLPVPSTLFSGFLFFFFFETFFVANLLLRSGLSFIASVTLFYNAEKTRRCT